VDGKGKGKETEGEKGKKVVINGPGFKKAEGEEGRDDDSHYFDSYAYNDMYVFALALPPCTGPAGLTRSFHSTVTRSC
jgi:hypothetical protein